MLPEVHIHPVRHWLCQSPPVYSLAANGQGGLLHAALRIIGEGLWLAARWVSRKARALVGMIGAGVSALVGEVIERSDEDGAKLPGNESTIDAC